MDTAQHLYNSAPDLPFKFLGWAIQYDAINRNQNIYMPDCFSFEDGEEVPLFWFHLEDVPIGIAKLFKVAGGIKAVGFLNDLPMGQIAKNDIVFKNLRGLSMGSSIPLLDLEVLPGYFTLARKAIINEISLVDSPGNTGAFITQFGKWWEDD